VEVVEIARWDVMSIVVPFSLAISTLPDNDGPRIRDLAERPVYTRAMDEPGRSPGRPACRRDVPSPCSDPASPWAAGTGLPAATLTRMEAPMTRIVALFFAVAMAETMTNAPQRRGDVEFSITYFLTGGRFLVKKDSPIQGIEDIAGKRVAVLQHSTYARVIRERAPKATLLQFADHPDAVRALVRGQADAYTNDEVQLYGLKRKLSDLSGYEVVGRFYTREPYAMAMRKDDRAFKEVVDGGLRTLLASGKYFKVYEKWFGPTSEAPYPMTPEVKESLLAQAKEVDGPV
jgi:Bacterial extracellular solute-binding proteins, family 3